MSITITTLIENSLGDDLTLYNEHGLSFFIEGENFKILYDTGQSEKFIYNAHKLNIDLSKITHAVMSHAHYDHTGGFKDLVQNTSSFDLYISEHFFRKKYALSGDSYNYLGSDFDQDFFDLKNIQVHYIKDSIVEIAPNVFLSTNFTRKNSFEAINTRFYINENGHYVVDDFRDEIVLSIKTSLGLIVLLGCSHPGVVNILETLITQTGEPIYAIIGGTHLIEANIPQIQYTLDYFKKIGIQHICVSHCTGELAIQKLREEFDCFFHNCTGTRIKIDDKFNIK